MVTVLPRSNPAEDLRSRALDPEPRESIAREPRYHPRSHYFPDPSQTYLSTPGVRSYRGNCTGCGATEQKFCPATCSQHDPLGKHNVLPLLRGCARCDAVIRKMDPALVKSGATLVLEGSPVVHVVLLGRATSLCGLVHREGAVEYLTA